MARTSDLYKLIRDAKSQSRKLLAIYLTCGFPKREWTVSLCQEIFAGGADFLELGMPFSDPLADGPTIQAASQLVLDNGLTSEDYFNLAAQASALGPTVFMGYLNSVTGTHEFLASAKTANLCGLILPEWPVHSNEFLEIETQAKNMNLPRVPFLAPTSSADRIAQIDLLDAPFIYAVAVTGVTGARTSLDPDVKRYLSALKATLTTPFLSGFGVSSPESARTLASVSDGVIVGSALLDGIGESKTLEHARRFTREFVTSLRDAIDHPLSA